MCGIAGIFGQFDGAARRVRKMTEAQRHRGPDDDGLYEDDGIVLGHRRLSILDPTPAGHQPMMTESGRYGIVFNGEIYNFKSLRNRLRGHGCDFTSQSDTEVLLYAFATWGKSAVERLNGDFAFAFYDRNRHHLLLDRDRLGVKPLYFTQLERGFAFSSEIRALVVSGIVDGSLNERLLPEYLNTQSVSPPHTLIEDVQLLSPGHFIELNEQGCRIQKYWDPLNDRSTDAADQIAAEAVQHVRFRLEKAIERQMVSDAPLGAFLSGGLDSTVVVKLMSRQLSRPIKTVALTFDTSGFDDGHYARIVADKFDTDHCEVSLSNEEVIEYVSAAINGQDHPSKDGINTYIVSTAARKRGLKVALSGLGGDELFAGYNYFDQHRLLNNLRCFWQIMPSSLQKSASDLLSLPSNPIAIQKLGTFLGTDGSLPELYARMRQLLFPAQINNLLHLTDSAPNIFSKDIPLKQGLANHLVIAEISKIGFCELTTYLHNVLLRNTDQMSMAPSLEVRVPLLDDELVDYVLGRQRRRKRAHFKAKAFSCLSGDGWPSDRGNKSTQTGICDAIRPAAARTTSPTHKIRTVETGARRRNSQPGTRRTVGQIPRQFSINLGISDCSPRQPRPFARPT